MISKLLKSRIVKRAAFATLLIFYSLFLFRLGYSSGSVMSGNHDHLRARNAINAFILLAENHEYDELEKLLKEYGENFVLINESDELFEELFSDVFIREIDTE